MQIYTCGATLLKSVLQIHAAMTEELKRHPKLIPSSEIQIKVMLNFISI